MEFDLIIIGAGPGGYEIAAEQAREGKRVAIVEKDLPGGTCLNRGCIPTKCLCAAAETLQTVKTAESFGITLTGVEADYAVAAQRAAEVVATLREGVGMALSACTVFNGEAEISSSGSVKVGTDELTAPKVLIATGSEPVRLPIPGAGLAMTSDEFLRLEKLPESLIIIGGGVIGMEFAYIASTYGVDVTVIEYCKEILPPFDAEIAKRLRTAMAKNGVKFLLQSAVKTIMEGDGCLTVGYADKKGNDASVAAEAVLMSVGRRPVVPAGLEEAGIETDRRGFIVTDNRMETTRPGFYAVGDCNGRLMLAHAATAQARVALGADVHLSAVPSAVFTMPEVAMVGLTTEQCKEQEIAYEAKKALYRANGKALASGHSEGLVKMLCDPETGKLLGCHIIGAHAADLIQEATLAISAGLTARQMGLQTVHGHPTLSEIVAAAI